jgi:hypothetical protein
MNKKDFQDWISKEFPQFLIEKVTDGAKYWYKDDNTFESDNSEFYCVHLNDNFGELMSIRYKSNPKWDFCHYTMPHANNYENYANEEKFKKRLKVYIQEYIDYIDMRDKAPAVQRKNEIISTMATAAGETEAGIKNILGAEGKRIVKIVWDSSKGKYRAQCDGLWVVFPSKLRIKDTKYMVDELVEKNGCYRVQGEIRLLGDI